jgi:hypothetical protein
MIEMLRIYSNGFLGNVTIEELPPGLSAERNTQTDDLEDSFLKSTRGQFGKGCSIAISNR